MNCSKCGTQQRQGSTFCHNCGNRVAEEPQIQTTAEQPKKKSKRRIAAAVCAALVFTAAVSTGVGYKAWTDGYDQGRESTLIDPESLEEANANAKKAYDIATEFFDDLQSSQGLTVQISDYEGSYDCSYNNDGFGLSHAFAQYFYKNDIGGTVYVGLYQDGNTSKLFTQWEADNDIGENAIGQYPNEIEWDYRYFVGLGDFL